MKPFKQYFLEQEYHNPRTGNFRRDRYERDTQDLLHQAEVKIKAMGDQTPDEIKQSVEELLARVNQLYSAAEQEATPAKGRLADKTTQIMNRSRELGHNPSYAEAAQYLLDIKEIIEG